MFLGWRLSAPCYALDDRSLRVLGSRIWPNGGVALAQRTSTQAVNRAVKAVAKLAGLDEREYSAHSLRAGLVTTASREGKRIDRIMGMSGHTSEKVVRGYIREGEPFRDNAADRIGL